MRPNVTDNVAVTSCPACDAALFTETGPPAAGYVTEIASRKFVQSEYFVRECSDCQLLYRSPTLSDSALEEYYAVVPFQKWEAGQYHPIERAVLSILRALPPRSRILDFGCSSGRLLSSLSGDYECYGSELNTQAAAEAARRGLTMIEPHDLAKPLPVQFDAIVLVDVFEHLRQPLRVLRRLLQHAAAGGVLILATGNGDAPACRRDPAQFWYFRTVEHLCMLTERHAQHLADMLDLSLAQVSRVSHYDLSVREKAVQRFHDFVYWQFRQKTLFASMVLTFLPRIRRAQAWQSAPTYTSSRDHAVVVFRR